MTSYDNARDARPGGQSGAARPRRDPPAFAKHGSARAIAAEAAGLTDLGLAARAGGAPAVRLLSASRTGLRTALLTPASPTPRAAEAFGRGLAVTHAHCPAGVRAFGQAPAGLSPGGATGTNENRPANGERPAGAGGRPIEGAMGAAPLVLVAPGSASRAFGEFYADDRLDPYLGAAMANRSIDADGAAVIHRLTDRLRAGEFDAPQPALVRTDAALLHGDLWAGNVLWATAESAAVGAEGRANGGEPAHDGPVAVLIDPASHGGHAESDLAQLTVFDAPFAERIYAAYDEASPLADGWRERIGLHRLHILIVHAALFGGSYGRQTVAQAAAYL